MPWATLSGCPVPATSLEGHSGFSSAPATGTAPLPPGTPCGSLCWPPAFVCGQHSPHENKRHGEARQYRGRSECPCQRSRGPRVPPESSAQAPCPTSQARKEEGAAPLRQPTGRGEAQTHPLLERPALCPGPGSRRPRPSRRDAARLGFRRGQPRRRHTNLLPHRLPTRPPSLPVQPEAKNTLRPHVATQPGRPAVPSASWPVCSRAGVLSHGVQGPAERRFFLGSWPQWRLGSHGSERGRPGLPPALARPGHAGRAAEAAGPAQAGRRHAAGGRPGAALPPRPPGAQQPLLPRHVRRRLRRELLGARGAVGRGGRRGGAAGGLRVHGPADRHPGQRGGADPHGRAPPLPRRAEGLRPVPAAAAGRHQLPGHLRVRGAAGAAGRGGQGPGLPAGELRGGGAGGRVPAAAPGPAGRLPGQRPAAGAAGAEPAGGPAALGAPRPPGPGRPPARAARPGAPGRRAQALRAAAAGHRAAHPGVRGVPSSPVPGPRRGPAAAAAAAAAAGGGPGGGGRPGPGGGRAGRRGARAASRELRFLQHQSQEVDAAARLPRLPQVGLLPGRAQQQRLRHRWLPGPPDGHLVHHPGLVLPNEGGSLEAGGAHAEGPHEPRQLGAQRGDLRHRRHHPGRGGGGELRPLHGHLDAGQPRPEVRQQLLGGQLPGPALPGGLQRLQVQRAGPAVLQPRHRSVEYDRLALPPQVPVLASLCGPAGGALPGRRQHQEGLRVRPRGQPVAEGAVPAQPARERRAGAAGRRAVPDGGPLAGHGWRLPRGDGGLRPPKGRLGPPRRPAPPLALPLRLHRLPGRLQVDPALQPRPGALSGSPHSPGSRPAPHGSPPFSFVLVCSLGGGWTQGTGRGHQRDMVLVSAATTPTLS